MHMCCVIDTCRAVKLAYELGRERNPSVVAHDRRSKLAKSRVEVGKKTREFNHWATEADKHIEHKASEHPFERTNASVQGAPRPPLVQPQFTLRRGS